MIKNIEINDNIFKINKGWGCKFTELRLGKPHYNLFIDDKNINSEVFFH